MEEANFITPNKLITDGYHCYKIEQVIFQKGKICITQTIRWQICDEEGHVGNEYIDTMEQLHEKERQIQ